MTNYKFCYIIDLPIRKGHTKMTAFSTLVRNNRQYLKYNFSRTRSPEYYENGSYFCTNLIITSPRVPDLSQQLDPTPSNAEISHYFTPTTNEGKTFTFDEIYQWFKKVKENSSRDYRRASKYSSTDPTLRIPVELSDSYTHTFFANPLYRVIQFLEEEKQDTVTFTPYHEIKKTGVYSILITCGDSRIVYV